MGFGKYIRSGVGLLGKTAMNYANGLTGGLAGQVLDKATDLVDKHSGLIGKVAKTVGNSFLNENTRNKISSFTDKAMKYIPEGKIKTALSKVNNIAQGRDANYTPKGGFNMSNITKTAAKGVKSVGKSVGKALWNAGAAYPRGIKEAYDAKDPFLPVRKGYQMISRIGNVFRRKPNNNNTPSETPVTSATPTVPTTAPQVLKAKRKII